MSPSASKLHAALLDYAGAPGKYQLTLRQPAILFASVREILQIAAGRGAPAGQAGSLREAATFFIRAALLYPGADHYAVLGLPPRAEPVELKERYRLLMRLTHPDFASGASAAWSTDAAVRVNRAYEVLSSPVLRRDYDEQLASLRSARGAEAAMPQGPFVPGPQRRMVKSSWHVDRRLGWGMAAGGALAVVLLLLPGPEPMQLVQKASPLPYAPPLAPVLPVPAPPEQAPAAPAAAALIAADVLAPAPPPPPARALPPEPKAVVAAAPAPVRPAPAPQARAAAPAAPPVPVVQAPAAPRPATAQVAALQRRAPPPATEPLPPPAAASPASGPSRAASPTSAPIASLDKVAALPVAAAPTLGEAQPLLTQLLQLLESGSGEQLLRLLESDARQAPSAQALSRQYEQLVRGARPVRLTKVEFQGEARGGVLLVTGRIRLHAGEPTIGSLGERFLVKAEFTSRGGQVLLTGLSGEAD